MLMISIESNIYMCKKPALGEYNYFFYRKWRRFYFDFSTFRRVPDGISNEKTCKNETDTDGGSTRTDDRVVDCGGDRLN